LINFKLYNIARLQPLFLVSRIIKLTRSFQFKKTACANSATADNVTGEQIGPV
jgi:hypothetical protein